MEETPINHLNMKLQVDDISAAYLKEIAKWGKFLAIVGFVLSCLIALFGIFIGTMIPSLSGASTIGSVYTSNLSMFLTIIYVAFAVLYFIPCLYLFKFSNRAKLALETEDQFSLNEAFANLKSCFKFIGISTIVVLAIYALAILGGIIVGALSR